MVLIGETGSGKSAQLVQFLTDSEFAADGSIVCTQPCKIAAISLADRVKEESNGCYEDNSIIFTHLYSQQVDSKVIFMTDHCLLQHYMNDKSLSEISCIIVDEAHERSLNTDLLLALLKDLLRRRVDLRLIIMSATANANQLSKYFLLRPSPSTSSPSPSTSFVTLPNELVTEVLACIAANSFADYMNTTLSCKDFNNLANDKYVLQRMSLEQFPLISWTRTEQADQFLERCKESGNPEALYRQGVVEFISRVNIELGIEFLKKAATLGHIQASYVLGLIMLYNGGEDEELKRQGKDFLNNIKFSKVTSIRKCRKEFKRITRDLWKNNKLDLNRKPTFCSMVHRSMQRNGWNSDDSEDEDYMPCQSCRMDYELLTFCNILNGN